MYILDNFHTNVMPVMIDDVNFVMSVIINDIW